ncbi:Serine/threonine protein phosphatase [Handroanthus impetiginosus]|uniref:protein-serine/threonine phosphatase n=1 Tax=Handroanthus impetiginosus TaxID=429701 RepID=A0A2G9HLK5_9LAMI|nr:Serine/threonine protein phosphatase [Handroanthus impetiginosus]
MERNKVIVDNVDDSGENECSGDGRPPVPNSRGGSGGANRYCLSSAGTPTSGTRSLVRHPSLVNTRASDISIEPRLNRDDSDTEFIPLLRSGEWADIGSRSSMEDVYVCADNLIHEYGLNNSNERPTAFYAVFDGHGGKHAADFACRHLPRFIVEEENFPQEIERIMLSAFLQTDTAFAEACSREADLASGTTALAAVVIGSSLVVANAGDCRAVLCQRGKAFEMSRDHKPSCLKERKRIEASGGYIYDGYLNGQLSVARALGDWHMEGLKYQDGGPLTAEPELKTAQLTNKDEFLIIGCDGIWDVFTSQNAVDFARRRLQEHNDPTMCSKDLVDEALKRKSGDNLAVVVVCFQEQPPPNLVVPRGRVHRSVSAEGLRELQSFLDSLEI